MQIEHKQSIAAIDCPSCGAAGQLKVNKNKCLYHICTAVIADGERCGFRMTYGRQESRALIREYLAQQQQQGTNNAQSDRIEAETEDPPAGNRNPENERSGDPDRDAKTGSAGGFLGFFDF